MADDFFDNLVNLSTPPAGDGDSTPSRRLESGIRRLTVLLDDLNRELRLKPLLDRTMDAAIQLTGAERGFLVLQNENGELDYRVANNDASQNIPDAERAASRTIIDKVLNGGEPILVNDIGDQADLKAQRSIAELQIHSVMGAPLRVKDRLLGAAYVDTTRPETIFTPEDLVLFQSFVHLAAIALENARLLEAERDARHHVQSLQAELRNILESLPLGVILIDSHSQIQFMNRSALEILSKVNLSVGDNLISEKNAEQTWRLKIFNSMADWMEGRNPEESEFDLEGRILKYSFFEVLRKGNDITQIGLLLEDVTENRALQRKLIESEKWSTVNLLAGGIAHEIKNSLQPICSGTDILQMKLDTKKIPDAGTLRHLETIQNAALRIQHIVTDLNRLTKPASPDLVPVNLIRIVQSTVNLMETTTGKLKHFARNDKSSKFQLQIDLPSELPMVHGNSAAIEGAVINLLLNAADAVQEKGHGCIRLNVGQVKEGWVTVQVEDTGVGISPRNLKHVLEPYFTTKSEGGTGLGLSIVRNTMEVHGGKVEIQSTPGEGTSISLHFPLPSSSSPFID
ncbi:GAF domain-containing protein [bacterium]|nr:GAF domain-containing protein [bacterium]